jgi:hypothetical protein
MPGPQEIEFWQTDVWKVKTTGVPSLQVDGGLSSARRISEEKNSKITILRKNIRTPVHAAKIFTSTLALQINQDKALMIDFNREFDRQITVYAC